MSLTKYATVVRYARLATAIAAVGFLAACGDDNNSTGPSDVTGAYNLSSVNDSDLPYTVPNVSGTEIIEQGQAVLNNDNTYTVQGSGTYNGSENDLVNDHGTYTHSGSHITFTSDVYPGSFTATVTSTTLTATVPGAIFQSSNTSITLLLTKAGNTPG